MIKKYIDLIDELWLKKTEIAQNKEQFVKEKEIVLEIISKLDQGLIRVCEKLDGKWEVNQWVKKAILLYFQLVESLEFDGGFIRWYDKVPPKFGATKAYNFNDTNSRIVPGAFIRHGAYLESNNIIMPSFINIGAYIGKNTMIDSWTTIGSCAQIGQNCHISGGAGIGGVLEPLQQKPVIIEDNCFIGARSEIVEGVVIETGAVIGMGVFIGASTKIIDRYSGKITYGRVPAYSVVVPGSLPNKNPNLPSLYCAVIIKTVDESTRSKTQINELLRT